MTEISISTFLRPLVHTNAFPTSITHTLTHQHTLLMSTRQLMGHNESENLTDFSFSTLPS